MKFGECLTTWTFAFIGILCTAGAVAQTSTPESTQASKDLGEIESFMVVTPEQLKLWWTPDKPLSQPIKYPVSALRSNVSGCVAVAFAIHADGRVTPIRLLHAVAPNADREVLKDLENAVIIGSAQSHYLPTSSNHAHSPVLTYRVTTFRIDGNRITDAEWKKKCEVPGFVREMQQAMSSPSSGESTR